MAGEGRTKSPIAKRQLSRRSFLGTVAGAVAASTLPATVLPAKASEPGDEDGDIVDVGIIGAGLAGLKAARDLRLAGSESFVVLGAQDRVGGRTLNHDLGDEALAPSYTLPPIRRVD
jgi:monoamine oxidase